MANRKKYNPEKRTWKGRSYKKGGSRVSKLRDNQGLPNSSDFPHGESHHQERKP